MGRHKGSKNLSAYTRDEWIAYFWARVDRETDPDGCWPWLDACMGKGYGAVRVPEWLAKGTGETLLNAHRVVLMLTVGPPPADGMLALHSCDNRPCCRPKHLRWGTYQDNTDDCLERGRWGDCAPKNPQRGEARWNSKLKPTDIPQIRALRTDGLTQQAIADRFGVSEGQIRRVLSGKDWRHV